MKTKPCIFVFFLCEIILISVVATTKEYKTKIETDIDECLRGSGEGGCWGEEHIDVDMGGWLGRGTPRRRGNGETGGENKGGSGEEVNESPGGKGGGGHKGGSGGSEKEGPGGEGGEHKGGSGGSEKGGPGEKGEGGHKGPGGEGRGETEGPGGGGGEGGGIKNDDHVEHP